MTLVPRTWPAGRSFPDAEALEATCGACGARWRVHENLAGFRFACGDCGAWVHAPHPAAPTALQIAASQAIEVSSADPDRPALDMATRPIDEMPRDEDGLVEIDLPTGVVYQGEIPSGTAMAPGSLHHVRVEERQRWSNRAGLEIFGMLAALLVPHVIAYATLPQDEVAALLPILSLVGGVLLVLVGLSAPQYTFGGLRRAKFRYFAEGVAVSAFAVALVVGWIAIVQGEEPLTPDDSFTDLRELLGSAMLVAVVAVAPAIFEELAFRGLLQGRLTAYMGRFTGIVATAALFALAHGISAGSPFHLGLGVYLGFLRLRSGSLLPGMLVHYLYNGSIVILYS